MEGEKQMIKLKSEDGEVFQVDLKCFERTTFLKHMLDTYGVDGIASVEIPVDVDSPILMTIIEWLEFHKEDGEISGLTEWDRQFFGDITEEIFDIMDEAHKLGISELVQTICWHIASIVRNRNDADLKALLQCRPIEPPEVPQIPFPSSSSGGNKYFKWIGVGVLALMSPFLINRINKKFF